jgi:hypothetical protein
LTVNLAPLNVKNLALNVLLPYGDRSRFGFKGEGRKVKTRAK